MLDICMAYDHSRGRRTIFIDSYTRICFRDSECHFITTSIVDVSEAVNVFETIESDEDGTALNNSILSLSITGQKPPSM